MCITCGVMDAEYSVVRLNDRYVLLFSIYEGTHCLKCGAYYIMSAIDIQSYK